MIAIVNNCELFEELAQELKSRWWKPGQHDSVATIKFENLLSIFQNLKSEAAGFLLDEAFLDIEIQFAKIMTPEWARPEATEAIDTVATTMEDYFEDYNYLRPKNFEMAVNMAQDRVALQYIGKKHALKKYDQFALNTFWEVANQKLPQLCNFTKFLLQK